jgi:hypothetical protein
VARNGSDTDGNGSVTNPYRTITHALTFVGSGDTIVVHPGNYTEDVAINNLFAIAITAAQPGSGAFYSITGNVTVSGTSSSILLTSIGVIGNITHSSSGSLYVTAIKLGDSNNSTTFTKSGTGYLEATNGDWAAGTPAVAITGNGLVTFNGVQLANLTVNSANASVVLRSVPSAVNTTLTSGTLTVINSTMIGNSNTAPAITTVAGTLNIQNSILLRANNTAGTMTVGATTAYLYDDIFFDRANSTLSGIPISGTAFAPPAQFQAINADSMSVTGNITGANVVIATTVLAATIGNAASVLFGDGANITGLPSGYSNSDVANYLASGNLDSNIITTANITGGNFVTVGGANVGTLTVTTDANIGGNALVTGNLTVEGNLVYINVESLTVEDPIITVGTGPNGAALTTNDGKDRGVAMEYFDATAKFAYAGYKNATGTYSGDYVIAKEATLSTDVVTVVTLANVVAGIYKGTFEAPGNTGEVLFNDGANIAANSTFTFDVANSELAVGNIVSSGTANVGTLEVTGEANVGGNLVITGNTDSGNITTLGTANIATLEVTGEANVGGNLVVTGNISGGNIATLGTANIGTLEVTGEANVAGNLTVTETATANIVSITTQAEIAGTSILSAGVVATSSTTPTTLFVGGAGFGYEVTVKASDGANIMITKLLSTPAGDYTLYGQTVTGNAPGAISVSSAANTVTVTVTSAAATPTTYTYQATGV